MTTQDAPYQLLPDLSPEEFHALKEDIRVRGILVAVEFDENGAILDGHHRLRAYQELIDEDVDVPMYDQKVVQFESEEAKKDYVLSINLKRRHLTSEQKATLYARLRLPPYNMTLEAIAAIAGVGTTTVWRHLDGLPDDVQETMVQLQTVGRDGKVYPTMYNISRTLIPAEKAERDHAASGYVGSDQSQELAPKYLIVIELTSEEEQADILEQLTSGWPTLKVRAVIS